MKHILLLILHLCAIASLSASESYIISSTSDRYGGNACLWISAILFAHANGTPLYHSCATDSCKGRFGNTVYHKILTDYCCPTLPPKNVKMLDTINYTHIPKLCLEATHMDIPTALIQYGFKSKWIAYFESVAQKKQWKLRWNPQEAIVIHVRLDDKAPLSIHDQRGTGDSPRVQGYMGDDKLKKILILLHSFFPEKKMYIITAPNEHDVLRCQRVTHPFSYVQGVFADTDLDYTLWQMMCSDVLVCSRSSFSMLAGFLHKGSYCFTSENWVGLDCFMGEKNQYKWPNLSTYLEESANK